MTIVQIDCIQCMYVCMYVFYLKIFESTAHFEFQFKSVLIKVYQYFNQNYCWGIHFRAWGNLTFSKTFIIFAFKKYLL